MGWFSDKAEEVKDELKFATEKDPNLFGKSKDDWKAAKDAEKQGQVT